MPENTPPESDPFADLYGRLPDPRTGARGSDAPPSRRAAREARRAENDTTDAPAAETVSDDAARRAPGEAPPRAAGQTPPRTPEATRAGETTPAAPAPETALTETNRRRAAAESAPAAPRAASNSIGASSPAASDHAAPATSRAGTPAPSGGVAPVASPRGGATPSRRETSAPAETARTSGRRADTGSTGPRRSASAAPATPARAEREPVLVGAGGIAAGASSSASRSAASGSLEQLFTGQTTMHDIGYAAPQPSKKRRHVGRWVALAVVVLLVGGIGGGSLALWNTYGDRVQAFFGGGEPLDYEAGQATGEARVTVVAGDTGASVSPKLFEAGVTKASNSLYQYMVDNNIAFTFQPGVYKLQQQMTSEAVLVALRAPETRLNYSVQLREGLTLAQSLDLITEQLGIPRADLDAAVADPSQYGVSASSLEGWIFPATYDFDEGVTAQQVIDTMVTRTMQSLDTAGVPEADRERILIIASIIEREARSSDDFYKVSRVIENRLQPTNQETFGKLEMDSTVQYGAGEMGSGTVSTSEEARNSDNPWNTYMYAGLPIGPIANPGDLAIDAAMKPADGPWLYFVTVNLDTGETVFTSTYSEHLAAVEQWRSWCAANPNSGC